jgi:uncharacterized paraquat-inducible protein A
MSLEFDCEVCDAPFTLDYFPFGLDVDCPKCGTVYTTDWDYVGEDSLAAWITGRKGRANEPQTDRLHA